MKLHFPKCSVCPVDPGIDCHAQRTGAAHAYCRKIRAGDQQARACVLDQSQPEPAPETVIPPDGIALDQPTVLDRAAKPRVPLGTPHCIPCQEAARSQSLTQA